MVQTTGRPERSRWASNDWDKPGTNPWAQEAIELRGYGVGYEDPRDEPSADEPAFSHTEEVAREYLTTLSPAKIAERDAAVRDAMGSTPLDIDIDFEDESSESAPPRPAPWSSWVDADATLDEMPLSVAPSASTREQSRGYVVAEGNWRESKGLPRKRKSTPPSRTREGRRAQHIREKAKRLGISPAEAEATTQVRQSRLRIKPS